MMRMRVLVAPYAHHNHHPESSTYPQPQPQPHRPYAGLPDPESFPDTYDLRCMVCYYGAHYSVFVWRRDDKKWWLYDDANVREIGTWQVVVQQCKAGRLQPLVLMYEEEGSQR